MLGEGEAWKATGVSGSAHAPVGLRNKLGLRATQPVLGPIPWPWGREEPFWASFPGTVQGANSSGPTHTELEETVRLSATQLPQ
jgi:hypothetical protein